MRKLFSKGAVLVLLLILLSVSASAGEQRLDIPILMYHHITEAEAYNNLTVSPERFRQDMQFLADNGFTPLLPADLSAISAGEMEMPLLPVMITFDDGYESNYIHAFPVLQETGMKAVIALLVQSIRTDPALVRWTLTWEQCREMAESGLVAFGSHSFNLHNADNRGLLRAGGPNGIQRLPGETQESYARRVGTDLHNSVKMLREYLGIECNYFSYPFGVADPWFYDLLSREGIGITVTTRTDLADLSGGTMDMPRYRVDMSQPLSHLLSDRTITPVRGVTAYISAATGQDTRYLPSVLVRGRHYVALSGIAGLLANTPAAFTYSDRLVFEPGTYREKWNQQIIEGLEVYAKPQAALLTFGEDTVLVPALELGGTLYFALEDLAKHLGYTYEVFAQAQTVAITLSFAPLPIG